MIPLALAFTVVLSSDPVRQTPATDLSCADRVYAYVKLSAPTTGTHLLEGRWYRPDGGEQEYTRIPLELKAPGTDSVHMWLQIERASDAVDALFSVRDDDRFDGRWTLDVFWDKKKVATRRFNLRCG